MVVSAIGGRVDADERPGATAAFGAPVRARAGAVAGRREQPGTGVRGGRRHAGVFRVGQRQQGARCRLPRVRRLLPVVGAVDSRPRRAGGSRRGATGSRKRPVVRRLPRGRGGPGGADPRRLRRRRTGAAGELRHGGGDDRDAHRPRGHRAAADRQVRGRLPRPSRQSAGASGVGAGHHRAGQLGRGAGADRGGDGGGPPGRRGVGERGVCRPRRCDRRRHRGAGPGQQRPLAAAGRVPGSPGRRNPPRRRAADRRRGDYRVPPALRRVACRRPAAARPGDARQDHRRRHADRRRSRPCRAAGAARPGRSRVSGRHPERQPAVGGGRHHHTGRPGRPAALRRAGAVGRHRGGSGARRRGVRRKPSCS